MLEMAVGTQKKIVCASIIDCIGSDCLICTVCTAEPSYPAARQPSSVSKF